MADKEIKQDVGPPPRSGGTLEARVEERTARLRAANDSLVEEIAARRRAEDEVHLLLDIYQAVHSSEDFHYVLKIALKKLCQFANWDRGEAWIPNDDGSALALAASWYVESPDAPQLEEWRSSVSFAPHAGLAGRVWASKRPEWVPDLAAQTGTAHRPYLMQAGVKATFGAPIVHDGDVLAVLVFLLFEKRTTDQRLIDIVSAVAAQLGAILHYKQTEEELGKSEALFRAVVDNSTRVIYLKDRGLRYLTVNGQFERLFQVTKEAVRGKTDYELFSKEIADRFRANDLTVIERGIPMEFEEIAPQSDGLHTYLSNKYPMFDSLGKLYAICGISTDITEQKRLEETLRISRDSLSDEVRRRTTQLVEVNQFLLLANRQKEQALGELKAEKDFSQKLIATAQDALVSIDGQARIVLFNPAAERIFGYARREVFGKNVNMLMAEPYAIEHDGYIGRYETTRESHAIGRIRTVTAKRKNGELFPVELSVTEIATDDDVHYAAFIRDISEKTRLQDELVEKEKLATVGLTAAKIGHELANPLNSISLALQVLELRVAKISTAQEAEKVVPNVAKIRDEVSRLNNLLLDFRAFARRETFRFRQTALGELIDEVIELEAPRLANEKVALEKDFPDDLPEVVIDRDKLKQVLLNLCRNAAEAMPDGGKITVKASASEKGVALEISDTGSGIPHDTDIFEPFFTTKKEGTGLGLTIVRQIIARHGGQITFRSQPGKGTTFRIILPRDGSGTSE